MVEYQLGEFEQGADYLDRSLEAMRQAEPGPTFEYASIAGMIPLIWRITGVHGHSDEARSAAEAVFANNNALPLVSGWARVGLALAAVDSGNETLAREQYDALESRRGTFMSTSSISVDHLLALTARTMGNPDQAMIHFEDALEFCREAGFKPEVAWTCYDYADSLIQRSTGDDRAKVLALLEESLAISTELGMRPLIEQATALREIAAAQPVRAPAFPDGLTQREVEVLGLVTAGKRDREIAEELYISVNTVGNHLRSILNKTNAANRTEAAAYAVRRGLAPDDVTESEA
jgi:DNA-binding CsgD family transcriptional regulator